MNNYVSFVRDVEPAQKNVNFFMPLKNKNIAQAINMVNEIQNNSLVLSNIQSILKFTSYYQKTLCHVFVKTST